MTSKVVAAVRDRDLGPETRLCHPSDGYDLGYNIKIAANGNMDYSDGFLSDPE